MPVNLMRNKNDSSCRFYYLYPRRLRLRDGGMKAKEFDRWVRMLVYSQGAMSWIAGQEKVLQRELAQHFLSSGSRDGLPTPSAESLLATERLD